VLGSVPALTVRMKRFLKFLHEVGTVGLMGAASAQMILSFSGDGLPVAELAATRHAILLISQWLLLPSLLVVLVSGLLAMAVHWPFQNAPWALIKLALTVLVFEGTLVAVQGPARKAAAITAEMAAGNLEHAALLPDIFRHERGGQAVILFLSVVNIALAVWRPRRWPRRRRRRTDAADAVAPSAAPATSTTATATARQAAPDAGAAE